ncbi:unnamed protein product [Rotaria sp. Silwood2]|nr:unnamed protein product [Rotaria sp. Silwood2]
MTFFIRDLNLEIERLHAQTSRNNTEIIVYRGQGLSNDDFNKLKTSKGELFSWNRFLSTSIYQQVSFMYADSARQNPNLTGILFQIRIESSQHSTSFTILDNISRFGDQEQEVIFTMHTHTNTIFQCKDSVGVGIDM